MTQETCEHILIHPRRGKKEKIIPEIGILLVNPSEAAFVHMQVRQSGGESRHLFNSDLSIAADQSFFVAGPAIGSPMAAMTIEKLIALGAKRLILFGWCGAIRRELRVGDILLPHQALSGEGTSVYYPLTISAAPSVPLCVALKALFHKNNVTIQTGCVWSTDAVYREDWRQLQQLQEDANVAAIDMEFSALCSVACFRKIDFAAVLIISDELWGEKWRPGFTSRIFLDQKAKALEVILCNIANL